LEGGNKRVRKTQNKLRFFMDMSNYFWDGFQQANIVIRSSTVVVNVIIGLFLVYYLVGRTSLPIKAREGEPML
jgi:hypothetical protein